MLTVAATGCLALFANGETTNGISHEVAQGERQAKDAVTNVAQKGAKPLMALGNKIHDARTNYVPLPGDDDSADPGYGRPMDGGSSGDGGGGGGATPARVYTGGPPIIGESQRSAALQQAEASPNGGAPGTKPRKQPRPSDEDLERLEAESEARS